LNETDDVDARRANDEALFLVELSGSERPRYAICQQIVVVDPDRTDNDVPWHELAALFRSETLRAVPMPGRASRGLHARRREAGVSTEPGVSTVIEVNLVKIERKD
jgi:hypothetical protein